MNKFAVAAGVLALTATVAAQAGPLQRSQGGIAPRLAAPSLRISPSVAMPPTRAVNLPGLAMAPSCQPRCGGGGPLDEPWIQYNLQQYPIAVQDWANASALAVQAGVTEFVSSGEIRGLGLVGGGIGPVPLPKLPEN